MDHYLHRAAPQTYALSESTNLFTALSGHCQFQRTSHARRPKAIPPPTRLRA